MKKYLNKMRIYDSIIFEIPILTVANIIKYIARQYHSQNRACRCAKQEDGESGV